MTTLEHTLYNGIEQKFCETKGTGEASIKIEGARIVRNKGLIGAYAEDQKNGRDHGMQTMYFETSSFIRHEGNLVDLAAYRQKLSAVSGGCWAPRFVELDAPGVYLQSPCGWSTRDFGEPWPDRHKGHAKSPPPDVSEPPYGAAHGRGAVNFCAGTDFFLYIGARI